MAPKRIAAALWGRFSGLGLAMAAMALAIDQGYKWWMLAVYRIQERGRVTVTPFLDLIFVKNTGISYGLFSQDGTAGQLVLIAIALVASLALTVWLARAETRLVAASVGLIIGGALANAIDRALHGGVADFFSLHAFGFYWYVFNLADVAIVAGVVGLLYDLAVPNREDASNAT